MSIFCFYYRNNCDMAEGIRQNLMGHLLAKNEILVASLVMDSLKTNERRISFAYDLLEENGLLPELSLDGKDAAKSQVYRQKGNDMFKKKKAREAHEFYTQSIAFAETGSEKLALAFANRSAVLFENGLYEECLKDIELALQCNYPEHLKPKLTTRQTKAKDLLPTQGKVDFFTPIPSIPKEQQNPLIQSAANNIRIETSETMGRHIIATRDIEPGEIIAIEKPFCRCLTDQFYIHCHHCLSVCYTLIPCPNCTEALFCSKTCQFEANQAYHQYECPILRTIQKLGLNPSLLLLRLTLLVRDKYKSLDQCELDKDGVYRSDRYNEIYNLVSNTSSRSVSDIFNRAVDAATFYHLLKKFTKFFNNGDENFEATFKELVLLHMQIGSCNFHGITEIKSSDISLEQVIGVGAYSFLSMFNHSCCPNVERYCYGDTMLAIAIERIRKGEQCFQSYFYDHLEKPKADRQAYLKEHFFFNCTCIACVNDYPQFEKLPTIFNFDLMISLRDLKMLEDHNLEEAKNIFSKLCGKIKKLGEKKTKHQFGGITEVFEPLF